MCQQAQRSQLVRCELAVEVIRGEAAVLDDVMQPGDALVGIIGRRGLGDSGDVADVKAAITIALIGVCSDRELARLRHRHQTLFVAHVQQLPRRAMSQVYERERLAGSVPRVNEERRRGEVRAADAADLTELLRLYRQLDPADPELDRGGATAALETILRTPGMTLLVIDRGTRLAATAYLNVIPNLTRSASPYALIENVVVDEPLRGTGVGKQIMAATLQAAWEADCYKAMLLTGPRRQSTHRFYRACGVYR